MNHEMPKELKQALGLIDPAERAMQIRDIDNQLVDFAESLTDEQLKVLLVFVGKAGMVPTEEYLVGMGQLGGFLISEKSRRARDKVTPEAATDNA